MRRIGGSFGEVLPGPAPSSVSRGRQDVRAAVSSSPEIPDCEGWAMYGSGSGFMMTSSKCFLRAGGDLLQAFAAGLQQAQQAQQVKG
jgi:hypothetical protein